MKSSKLEDFARDFLRRGNQGALKVGLSSRDVTAVLGAPSERGRTIWGGDIWGYAARAIQVYLEADEIVHIGLYFQAQASLEVPVGASSISERTTESELVGDLRSALARFDSAYRRSIWRKERP